MKRAIVLVCVLIWSASLAAQESAKLTLQQCISVSTALRAFDGYSGVDKEGKSAPMQYKLGELRKTIYLIQAVLEPVIKANDAVRMDLLRQYLPNGTPAMGSPEYEKFMGIDVGAKRFTDEWQKMLAKPQDVVVPRIKLDDLNLGDPPAKNPIPPSVLSALDPIIDR